MLAPRLLEESTAVEISTLKSFGVNPLARSSLLHYEAGSVCEEEFSFRTGIDGRLGEGDTGN